MLARKIAHNTIIQIIGKSINVLIGVFAISYLTRYLSPSGFGQYITVLTFLQIFGIFLDFGLSLVLLQEMGKDEANQNFIFSNILTLRIVLGFSIFIIAPAIALFFPYPNIVKWGIVLTSLAFFLNSLTQVYSAIFQKQMRMDKVVLAEAIGRILFFIFIILVIFVHGNLLLVLMASNINSLIFFGILAFAAKKYIKYKWQINWEYWKRIIKLSWPIGLTIVLNLIYFKADTLILSIFQPSVHIGFYGAPYKILEVITTLPHLILGLVLPIFTFYWFKKNKEEFKKIFQSMFNFFIVIGCLIIVLFTVEAKGIINFIAGPEYPVSTQILKILIWPTTVIFFSSLFNYGIIAIEKQRKVIKYFLITAIMSIIGYLIFIPKFTYFGAAYVTLAAEALIAVFSYLLIKKYTGWKIKFQILLKVLLISIITYLLLSVIKIHFVIELIIGAAIYFVLLILFKVLNRELIKEVISYKR